MNALHPIQRRMLAEDLVRLRRADEDRRYATSQRRGRIDPNPHQIDAVIFALQRIREGGCILADEVGLGKTIEAGLVIAQLLAEGWRRILIIAPRPLIGQWHQELYSLFGIEAREGDATVESLRGDGVFLIGRETAGGEKGSRALLEAAPFDLCIIDEAHELFAGIWRRFDRPGGYREKGGATMADRVRRTIRAGDVPVMLLTATPIQNSLAELWGLVHYVEPTGTLFGDLPTFRRIFCDGDDRKLIPEQEYELKHRLASVQKRTLRRQAQEFLETPFVDRHAQKFTYWMSPAERALYEDVTAYLLEPNLCAFAGKQRQLLLISFHRLMASSKAALVAGLRNVAQRLQLMLRGEFASAPEVPLDDPAPLDPLASDLDDEDLSWAAEDANDAEQQRGASARERIAAEFERVMGFIRRAEGIEDDSKATKVLEVIGNIRRRERTSGKVIVFTESLTTQKYLRELLIDRGIPDEEITIFRGNNDSPRALQALERWSADEEPKIPPLARPKNKKVRMRLALVHEFRSRSSVFISTEAGAKGLNLQFCESLINYDLPWNPQRIEQRIGRCHRYGQKNAVTVINFLAEDNETEALLFEILAMKLDLFGQVLDASDAVIHSPKTDAPETLTSTMGSEVERELGRIYQRARNIRDVQEELKTLRATVEERRKRFEETQTRTENLVKSRLDENVRVVFRGIQDKLPQTLAELDRDVEKLVSDYLRTCGAPHRSERGERRTIFEIEPNFVLPAELAGGGRFLVGEARETRDADVLHIGHLLVRSAVEEARAATAKKFRVAISFADRADCAVAEYSGKRGRLAINKVRCSGFDPVDRLLVTALFEGDSAPLPPTEAALLLEGAIADAEISADVDPEIFEEAIEELIFLDQAIVAEEERVRFERAIEQIERYADDRILILKRDREAALVRHRAAESRRDAALGPDQRNKAEIDLVKHTEELERIDASLEQLRNRNDEAYRKLEERAHRRRFLRPEIERVLEVEFEVR